MMWISGGRMGTRWLLDEASTSRNATAKRRGHSRRGGRSRRADALTCSRAVLARQHLEVSPLLVVPPPGQPDAAPVTVASVSERVVQPAVLPRSACGSTPNFDNSSVVFVIQLVRELLRSLLRLIVVASLTQEVHDRVLVDLHSGFVALSGHVSRLHRRDRHRCVRRADPPGPPRRCWRRGQARRRK